MDADTAVIHRTNAALGRLLGYSADELRGVDVTDLLQSRHRDRFQHGRRELAANGAGHWGMDLDWIDRGGRLVRSRSVLEVVAGQRRLRLRVMTCVRAGRSALDAAAEESERPSPETGIAAMVDAVQTALVLVDGKAEIHFVNRAAREMFRLDGRTVCGGHLRGLFGGGLRAQGGGEQSLEPAVTRAIETGETQRLSLWGRYEDSTGLSCEVVVTPLTRHGTRMASLEIHDVTETRRLDAKLRFVSNFDAVTGLPNREQFLVRLADAIRGRREKQATPVLIFLDLDGFKKFNESLGHARSDQVLREVAERLKSHVRVADTVARLGGDEFGLLLEGADAELRAAPTMRHLLAAVAEPVFADGNELFVTASMGAAVCGFGATEPDTLLRNAEIAMYRAKEQGRNSFCFYTPGLESGVPQRVRIEAQLRHALEREEFSLCYQPVVDSASRRIVGAEALLRWHHPELGPVSPREFVPVLEETKLIIPVGTWVLEQACRAAVEMDSDNERGLQMAVNVSREQVREPGFVRAVEQALTNSGLSPARLVVEITESLLMEQSAPVIERLEALERRGVGIAVDDFGTGYSSLSYLKRFPVTSLKIDRSFVGGVPGDQDDRAIVVAIMAMARSLGLSVVAEGVETAEQARFLEQWPGSRAQGYYFGAPMEANALSDRLRELEPTGSD